MSGIKIDVNVDLECYILHAETATPRRPYILPVLLHVERHDGKTDAEILSTEMFPGLKPLSQKLLDICENEEQIERDDEGRYGLTYDGRNTISSGRLFERGAGQMWKVHYADCDLIPEENRVVRMEAVDSKEVGYNPTLPDAGQLPIRPMPDHITELEGKILRCMSGDMKGEFKLYNIYVRGKIPKPESTLKLSFHLGGNGSRTGSAELEKSTVSMNGKISVRCTINAQSEDEFSMALPDREGSLRLDLENPRADW